MKILTVILLLGVTAGTAAAQDSAIDSRVAAAMTNAERRYEAAACSADKDLHFKSSSGRTYLKTAIETSVDDNKLRALENGQRNLVESITDFDQGQSAGAWYYLGRIYLRQGDIVGADSAFTRAVALAPDCAEDIKRFRRLGWAALVNASQDMMKAQQNDSAASVLRAANRLYRDEGNAYLQLASISYDAKEYEQSLAYFDSAVAASADSVGTLVHEQAKFNKAIVLLQLNRGAEAVPVLREFVAAHPDDVAAAKALITAFQAAGMRDSANAVAKRLEAMGETVERTAVVEDSPFNRAVAAFNEERWADATAEAQKAVTAEPYNRDALYILAASNYREKKGEQVVRYGKQLVAIDPMSEAAIQMLGFGYNLTKRADAVPLRVKLNAMPFGVSEPQMRRTPTGATFTATATGRKAMDSKGAPIAPAGQVLVLEFLNADGAVAASQEVSVPALNEGETFAISASATGNGIVAWRYKKK